MTRMHTDDELGVSQRTVPASSARRPPTSGHASVFDIARPTKPKSPPVPPLDPSKVAIRSGVPIPEPTAGAGRTSASRVLLQRMKVGDSVELLTVHARSLAAIAKKDGVKVAVRRVDDTHSAVWRMS